MCIKFMLNIKNKSKYVYINCNFSLIQSIFSIICILGKSPADNLTSPPAASSQVIYQQLLLMLFTLHPA